MSNIDKRALREAAEKATALNLDTAQLKRRDNGFCECPVCFGEGYVDVESDYCNIDGVALGVLFYGMGKHRGLAEEYFRAANPATVLALLDELEAKETEAEWMRKRIEELAKAREVSEEERVKWFQMAQKKGDDLDAAEKRIAELEAKQVKIKLPESFYPDGDIESPLVINEYQIIEAIVAAGCKPIAVCPRCKCELDLTHKSDGAHYCHPAAAGKGE
ncbi:MAG: ead/Ea22-like family protein [Enterobacter ludwigii]|nr:ead/Ea22-like family protein [Enterobacter ludwigii]